MYICFVIKLLFKYCFIAFVLILGSVNPVNAHGIEQVKDANHETSFANDEHEDRFIHTFISSNEEGNQNDNSFVVLDKEVDDDDENQSHKHKVVKRFSSIIALNNRDITCVICDLHNHIPSYTHFEEIYESWYKLYQVFRI